MNLDLFADDALNGPVTFPFILPQLAGYSARWCENKAGYIINLPQGELIYMPSFLPNKISDRSLEYFLENSNKVLNPNHVNDLNPDDFDWLNIPWAQDEIEVYGKRHRVPRLSSWHGDAPYAYSNNTLSPNAWNKALLYLKQKIEHVSECAFNSVLLNCYRDGRDCVGWHGDDESELGVNPIVASLSLGEQRRFLLRNNSKPQHKIEFSLAHGDLLIMGAGVQSHYQHCVPKALKVTSARINLTFRYVYSNF